MLKEDYRQSLATRIKAIDTRIALARETLKIGTPKEKVASAGVIAVLEHRHGALCTRLKELEAAPEGAWAGIKAEAEREIADIADAIERLIVEA